MEEPTTPPPPPPTTTLVIRDEPAAAPAAAEIPVPGEGGGFVVAVRQLFELRDRRVQACAFFFVWGSSVVLHGTTMLSVSAAEINPEHVLAGYGLFTVGAALGFLTLSGSRRFGRAAARVEEVLRGLLFH